MTNQTPAPRTLTLYADGGFDVVAFWGYLNRSEILYAHWNPGKAISTDHVAKVIEWEARQGAVIVDKRVQS